MGWSVAGSRSLGASCATGSVIVPPAQRRGCSIISDRQRTFGQPGGSAVSLRNEGALVHIAAPRFYVASGGSLTGGIGRVSRPPYGSPAHFG
jgi:hypothetical protein